MSESAADAPQPEPQHGGSSRSRVEPPQEAPLRDTDLIDRLLVQAVEIGASDLHIEPMPGGATRLRLRIDGTPVDVDDAVRTIDGQVCRIEPFPVERLAAQLRGRLTSKAGFNQDDSIPQDGAMSEPVSARVATIPTVDGVLMVLRLFPARTLYPLEWMSKRDEVVWAEMMTGRGGLIIVSGPTGSGKSTTVLNALEDYIARGKLVSTIEDPVEYRLAGARQSEVSQRAGFTELLKGLARVDSDVVFVGEMREAATVETVITAANRGRTVFSTVHAIDAASTPASLEALGVDMAKVANVLGGIVAQRLLRKVCAECGGAGRDGEQPCPLCHGVGYYGRVAVREVLQVTNAMRDAIRRNASPSEIEQIARAEGMKSMAEYAEDLIEQGLTTPAEVKEHVN